LRVLDKTHDPELRSWVEGTEPGTDFPIQNLPFGRYRSKSHNSARVGVAIGDSVLDLHDLAASGILGEVVEDALLTCAASDLKDLMALPPEIIREVRGKLSSALEKGSAARVKAEPCLVPRSDVTLLLPTTPGNYTDFFASIHHAQNAGRIRRPENPLLPNFHHIPVAYHGRASTIRVSGNDLRRPFGQVLKGEAALPVLEKTDKLDFECELAVWIGRGNEPGDPIALASASEHVFGLGLLNDWSARDIQTWETQPLGPFLSKNFLTTVSPWIVTMDALAPFRVPTAARAESVPRLLPYLDCESNNANGGLDIRLSVQILTQKMRAAGERPVVISRPQFKHHYWTIFQMVAHHTINGCELLEGDILGTGTISGPSRSELGCMLELNLCGKERLPLPNGESRMWLEDGDEIILGAHCEKDGYVAIGFGEARATVLSI